MDRIDSQGYRANVGMILMDGDGHVLIGGRAGRRGWQFPQGGIRPRESEEEAMYRELKEKLDLSAATSRPWDARATGCAIGCRRSTAAISSHFASARSSGGIC